MSLLSGSWQNWITLLGHLHEPATWLQHWSWGAGTSEFPNPFAPGITVCTEVFPHILSFTSCQMQSIQEDNGSPASSHLPFRGSSSSFQPPAAALSCFSCVQLCNPMDWSLLGSYVHGILQARILEWVAMPAYRGSSQPRNRTQVSRTVGRFFPTSATCLLGFNSLGSFSFLPPAASLGLPCWLRW